MRSQPTPKPLSSRYQFKGYPSDGSFPFPSLVGSGGALYGGLDRGGASHAGAVYSLTPSQKANEPWTETILYNFSGEEGGNGGGPTAVGPGGVLYGVSGGGAHHYGQVFSLTPPVSEGGAWTYSVLYDFTGETDGYFPEDVILGPNGVLYGITSEDTYGRYFGNVFALTPPTAPGGPWAESTLFGFDGTNGGAATGLVLGSGGVLYASGNSGIVFSLTPPPEPGQSWTYSILASVGNEPFGIALGPGGVLYGTTTRGETGLGAGSVYSLTPPIAPGGAWTFNQLYEFPDENGYTPDGAEPAAPPVIGSNGVVYGTASIGGNGTAFDGFGVVFSLTPPDAVGGAWSEQTLYEFQGGNDGSYPTQLILTRNGVIYGIANDYSEGGTLGGSIFALEP